MVSCDLGPHSPPSSKMYHNNIILYIDNYYIIVPAIQGEGRLPEKKGGVFLVVSADGRGGGREGPE
jgi:hypothetical protein